MKWYQKIRGAPIDTLSIHMVLGDSMKCCTGHFEVTFASALGYISCIPYYAWYMARVLIALPHGNLKFGLIMESEEIMS